MNDRLRGKVALVTGSTSNIGRAIACRFAAEGAKVVVTGRDAVRGRTAVEAIGADGGEAQFVPHVLDGSVESSRKLAASAAAVYGPIEILVNNAGIYPSGGTLDIDGDTFDRIWKVNVKAPYFLTAALMPAMIKKGHGVVINLGSWGARLGLPGGTAYGSTKGAVETLTRSWAAEFGAQGVRVNAISPGVTFDDAHPVAELAGPMMDTSPLGRLVTPDAVARAAVFLASDDATDIHGSVLDVDGGRASVLFAAR
jgi:NAD(P)-dependent dehydrogenase (short-subunit alcohol dehydrogenase family)